MVTTNLSPPTPHTSTSSPPIQHRQNRRRERPGSRARRSISRKTALATDLNEGILEARDSDFYIPNHRPGNGASPLLRQNFDQSWMRWKARQTAELEMLAMKQNMKQLEMERQMMIGEMKRREEEELGKMQRRLFGGDDDDDDVSCDIDLCPAMLDVVLRLFDGEVDYLDP
ncbi:413a80c5-d44e-40e1-9bf3-c33b4eb519a6 [Sclerotinia trifoliorum]|uniref:413a80c5-d44e-40e1-9bf3-c33b4eb519a6 n=1 Tax=Sclerotinia trifoliorum TaxID=28548 RepID=A0A8H2VQX8_9HELO|nr:413a80c5-d44e-40e1-9bf3-c33b4eb519a6 [Sclerotinia trifoliorum]